MNRNEARQVRRVSSNEWEHLSAFYRRNRYKGRPEPAEEVWCVTQGEYWLAAARLCYIGSYPVLRGVWVDQSARQQGIGRLLLETLKQQGRLRNCYCFTEVSLVSFYQRVGFDPVLVADIPQGLQRAFLRYNRHSDREPVVLLQMLPVLNQNAGHSRNSVDPVAG